MLKDGNVVLGNSRVLILYVRGIFIKEVDRLLKTVFEREANRSRE